MFTKVTSCPISGDTNPIPYLDLGLMPLVNNLNSSREESLSCKKFPLLVNYYSTSGLSTLSGVVDPKVLFSNYVYKSGVSQPYIEHCKHMFEHLNKFVKVKIGDVFLDIGGNDGTLLKTFQSINGGIWCINVDPAKNLGSISREGGISTIDDFWSSKVANNITHCKVVTSTNVFQHTQPIRDFAEGVKKVLSDDGVWCLEFPYWKMSLDTRQFDQVYHEHIYYYMITPLKMLFDQIGLEIIDISQHSIHGGTLRVISRKKRVSLTHADVTKEYIKAEKHYNIEYLVEWGKEIKQHTVRCKKFLDNLKHSGLKIAAFGAAAKGCIFLNAAGITHETIDFIVDDTDTKWGKFMPGTGIEIFPRSKVQTENPDIMVILAHNFAEYISKSVRPIFKGKFVTMFPTITYYE